MAWLPDAFEPPRRVTLTSGHHLRPIRATDIDIDYPAVMGSRARLWEEFGAAWGWPPATMTREQDLADLVRHEREMAGRASYNYALLTPRETELLGCVYIDPPEKLGSDADISWWVVDDERDGPLERLLAAFLPVWIAEVWPFLSPRLIGADLSWADYLALPDRRAASPGSG